MSVVLIAEDEAALLEVLSDAVAALGHQVVRAMDGAAALTLIRAQRPDLLITDNMMPRMTGLQLLEKLKEEPELAKTPVLLMSASRPRGAEASWAFLAKPITLRAFEKQVTELLEAHGQAAPTNGHAAPAERDADAASRARDEMLRWVAHEFKTPLSAAQMASALLLKRLAKIGEPADAERVRLIMRQHDRLNQLVTSVLDAAKLADGKMILARERRSWNGFLEEIVATWRELKPELDFTFVPASEEETLSFDPERVRQILDNLVSNAVKYGEGKAIKIEAGLSPGLATVRVIDQGPGIDAVELPRLFERFHRVDDSPGKGHGLGLYIASMLAKLHGGTLTARSTVGFGSTFCLSLPRAS